MFYVATDPWLNIGIRFWFYLMEQALYLVYKKWLIPPITFVLRLYQYLTRPVFSEAHSIFNRVRLIIIFLLQ